MATGAFWTELNLWNVSLCTYVVSPACMDHGCCYSMILSELSPTYTGSSPYTIENVSIGEHHFKIIPRGCGRNFRGHPQKFNIN